MKSLLLKELIEEKADQFSPGYQKLAHYLIENGDEAVFMSVREIAHRLSTSEAMVVRFAQELGFKGFRELQDGMQGEFRRLINMVSQARDTMRETDVIRAGKESDHTVRLAARRGPIKMFHSLVVPMARVDSLIIGTALKMGQRALMNLEQLDSLREKYRYSKIGAPTAWEQEQMDQVA